jgi:NtrC-family two-component system sensor histidine kinase KinB
MGELFVLLPILAVAVLIGAVWVLRRRPRAASWNDNGHFDFFDAVEDAVLVYDQSGHLVHLNPTARAWFDLGDAVVTDSQSLNAQVLPPEDFSQLLSREGRASLEIDSRRVEAISRQIDYRGVPQVAVVMRSVGEVPRPAVDSSSHPDELRVLRQISRAISNDQNPDALLSRLWMELGQLFSFTGAAVSRWNSEAGLLVVRGCTGLDLVVGDTLDRDNGFAYQIVQERAPLLQSDVPQRAVPYAATVRSYAGAPLMLGGKCVGTLELFSDHTDAFSSVTLDLLQIVANQLAAAIESLQLQKEMLLRDDELATMNTLSAAINASLNLDELLEISVYSVSQAIECDRSAIFLMDNERGLLSLAKSRGLSENFVRHNQNIRPQLDAPGQVVLDRYPLVVNDVSQLATPSDTVALLKREKIAAYVDLPLRGRETVLGALTVYYDEPHHVTESDLELMQTIANQVTLALENARLYERTDRALARRVDQLAAIEEIGRELTSTLDITRVFNLVLQRVMGTTGASAGLLAICDDACSELQLIVDRGYPAGTLERYWKHGWPTSDGIVGRVARTGTTMLVNDVQADPSHVFHLPDTCAQLIVPVVKEERVLGVVSLESSRAQGFSTDDVRFTTQLAELAAIAIDNARLFEQVREGRDNLQAILDSTHEGILVIGADNRIVLANPMIEELGDLSALELVGRRVDRLETELALHLSMLLGFTGDELEEALKLLDPTSDKVVKRTYELPGSTQRHIAQVVVPVVHNEHAVVGRVLVMRDVTEERQLAMMRQDLTDMIIHDLRSPLTAVIGGVQVASDLIESSADKRVIHHALDMATQSCNHLMSLVDSLLDISRLEAGQMPLERHPILLPQLVQSVVHRMKPLAESESVALELRSVSLVPPVFADYELISRVLVNLIDNALKHSPANGAVIVEVASHEVASSFGTESAGSSDSAAEVTEPPEQYVRCTVLDSGSGIPPESRQRVFERFAQLDGRRRGKGLGLAFCQLAVRAHGGQIWVDDNPQGPGSAFSFLLPIVPSDMFSPDGPDAIR